MTQDYYARAINYTSRTCSHARTGLFPLGYDCLRETLVWTEQEGAFSYIIWEMQKNKLSWLIEAFLHHNPDQEPSREPCPNTLNTVLLQARLGTKPAQNRFPRD